MRTIEIWPKEIEGGDAVGGDFTTAYLKLTDPEQGLEVIAFLGADQLAQLGAMASGGAREGKPH